VAAKAQIDHAELVQALERIDTYHMSTMSKASLASVTKQESALSTVMSTISKSSRFRVVSSESVVVHVASDLASPSRGADYFHQVSRQSFEILPSEVELLGEIGRGAFGIVYKGLWRKQLVAVKKLIVDPSVSSVQRVQIHASFEQEVAMLCSVKHASLLLAYGACLDPASAFIVSEYMPKGSLFDLLHGASPTPPTESQSIDMALQILRGVVYMHCSNPIIIHRDIKSHNVLIDSNGVCKISDFGLAKTLHRCSTSNITMRGRAPTDGGTLVYMSPEVLAGKDADETDDMYAVGVLLWELFSRQIPWAGKTEHQIISLVSVHKRKLPQLSTIQPQLDALLQQLMAATEMRPTADQALQRLEDIRV
jgi:serine/threonine protein kinase